MRILAIPRVLYEDGAWVLVEHLQEASGSDQTRYPVAYVRRYVYEAGEYRFVALNPNARIFRENEVRIVGLVILRRVEHAQGWYSDERCDTGLPFHAP